MQLIETRIDIFKMLPSGTVGAEIGVCKGWFSVMLMELPLKKLYLIDPWSGTDGSYGDRKITEEEQQANFDETCWNLRGHMPGGRVEMIRGRSLDVARENTSIPPLDWAYIDAVHDKESVKSDLIAWSKRLKPSGFLSGHDWTNDSQAKAWGFGVIEAVNEFCEQFHWRLSYLTREPCASFRIDRS